MVEASGFKHFQLVGLQDWRIVLWGRRGKRQVSGARDNGDWLTLAPWVECTYSPEAKPGRLLAR